MSRQQLLSVCVGLSFCFLLSCCASQNYLAQPRAFVGQVYVIGNEPFTKFALKLADGQTYILDCTKQIETTLLPLQGQTVRLIARAGAKKSEVQSLQVVQAETVRKE